jgi:hypothetical protein
MLKVLFFASKYRPYTSNFLFVFAIVTTSQFDFHVLFVSTYRPTHSRKAKLYAI